MPTRDDLLKIAMLLMPGASEAALADFIAATVHSRKPATAPSAAKPMTKKKPAKAETKPKPPA